MKLIKKLAAAALVFTMVAGIAAPTAYAETRKKIGSVSLTITSNVQPETKFGSEEISVEVKSGKCSYDYYEINNVGFEWEETDVPEITIYLNADDGYYFSLDKASSLKLSGATYVKASKQDSSETLKLVVKLPSLAESLGDFERVKLTSGGYAVWDAARGAGTYEVRLYRNGEGQGATILSTKDLNYDFTANMSRPGAYFVRVRPVNKVNTEKKGAWVESETINITPEMAAAIKNGTAEGLPVKGTWKLSGDQWWYEHEDKTYTSNNWEQIDEKWYFFDENGYMKTGWIEWDGKMFYCDKNSGVLQKNTTTPDGYIVGSDGSRKTGR